MRTDYDPDEFPGQARVDEGRTTPKEGPMSNQTDQAERVELITDLLKLRKFVPSNLRSKSALRALSTAQLRDLMAEVEPKLNEHLTSFAAKGDSTDTRPFLNAYGIAAGFIGIATVVVALLILWLA